MAHSYDKTPHMPNVRLGHLSCLESLSKLVNNGSKNLANKASLIGWLTFQETDIEKSKKSWMGEYL